MQSGKQIIVCLFIERLMVTGGISVSGVAKYQISFMQGLILITNTVLHTDLETSGLFE